MYFGEDNLTISIKSFNTDCSNTFYLISRNGCRRNTPEIYSGTATREINISKSNATTTMNDDGLVYFDVLRRDNQGAVCSRGVAPFQIDDNGIILFLS